MGFGSEETELTVIRSVLLGSKNMENALKLIFTVSARELEQSGFHAGCPIGTVAAEAPEAAPVCQAIANAFGQWHAVIQDRLEKDGLRSKRAGELAEFVLASFEGALLLAKAKKTTEPIDNALRELIHILRRESA